MSDPRNLPIGEWSRERWAAEFAAIGWDLVGYEVGSYRPSRSYAAQRDFPGIPGKRITAEDPRTLYTRCEATNATRAAVRDSEPVTVHAGTAGLPARDEALGPDTAGGGVQV